MSNYVRESVLVEPMPDGPFIRVYNYCSAIRNSATRNHACGMNMNRNLWMRQL